MSVYIGNNLEDRLEALEVENASLRKYNEYHQVVHEIDTTRYYLVNILLAIVKMIEYINLLLLLTIFGSTCYVYYRLKKIFCLISVVMESEILDQLTD